MQKLFLAYFIWIFTCPTWANSSECQTKELTDMVWQEVCTYPNTSLSSAYQTARQKYISEEGQFAQKTLPRRTKTDHLSINKDPIKVTYVWKNKRTLWVTFDYEASSSSIDWKLHRARHNLILTRTVSPP